MMEMKAMEDKLESLIHMRDESTGLDRKRMNYKIATLQNQMEQEK